MQYPRRHSRKHNVSHSLCLMICCCLGVHAARSVADAKPAVKIDSGTLDQGAHFEPARDELMFLGTPFAAPLTGKRR
jgi:hypothetical protein